MGFAPGRIPWFEAHRYALFYGFDDEDIECLIDLIERLDVEDLNLIAKESETNNGKNRPPGRRD